MTSRGPGDRIKTYWRISQDDAGRLREIISEEGPLDLVIDDASHLYRPTKVYFETVLPLLRPGGFYIIEDWAWAHVKVHQENPYFAREPRSLTDLPCDFVELRGSSSAAASITVVAAFVAVERGEIDPTHLNQFSVERHISRRPTPPISKAALWRWILRRLLRLKKRVRT